MGHDYGAAHLLCYVAVQSHLRKSQIPLKGGMNATAGKKRHSRGPCDVGEISSFGKIHFPLCTPDSDPRGPVDTMQRREPFAANGMAAGPELIKKNKILLSFAVFLKGLRDRVRGFKYSSSAAISPCVFGQLEPLCAVPRDGATVRLGRAFKSDGIGDLDCLRGLMIIGRDVMLFLTDVLPHAHTADWKNASKHDDRKQAARARQKQISA